MMLAMLTGGTLSASQSPAELLTATQAHAAGAAIPIVSHPEPGGTVVAVELASARRVVSVAAPEQLRREALRLLGFGSAGSVAIRDVVDDPGSGLTIARVDGSQTKIALPGVTAAAFAASEAWLAAVDASGRLWKVNPVSGHTTRLANGPYLGSLAFTRDGSLLLSEVSSVGAPYSSRLVRFNPDTARSAPLMTDPGFVFSARELNDGSVAVVMHPFGGGVTVRRIITSGATVPDMPLDPRAIDVTLTDDGAFTAYAVFGDGVYVVSPAGSVRRVADGDLPRIAPNGASILMLRGSGSSVVTLDGQEIARFPFATTRWASCEGRCGS
jgi:hypothetical protein